MIIPFNIFPTPVSRKVSQGFPGTTCLALLCTVFIACTCSPARATTIPSATDFDSWTILPGTWNSDTNPDVMVLQRESSQTLTWFGNSDGSLQDPLVQQLNGIGPIHAEKIRFLSGGIDQMLVSGYDMSTIDIYRISSSGVITQPPYRSFRDGFQPLGTVADDFTGDGFLDIVSYWYGKPMIYIHRQASFRFNFGGVFQASRTGEPLSEIHHVISFPWDSDSKPEIVFTSTNESGTNRIRILNVVDLGGGSPSMRLDEIETIILPQDGYRKLAAYRMLPESSRLLLVWGSGLSKILMYDPTLPEPSSPENPPVAWDLGFPVDRLMVLDADQDLDDDWLALSEDRTEVVLFETEDGVPTEAAGISTDTPIEAWASSLTNQGMILWMLTEPDLARDRKLLKYSVTSEGLLQVLEKDVAPVSSPFSEPVNLVLERPDLKGGPSFSSATIWAGGLGDWTVSGSVEGSNQIVAQTRNWITPDVLGPAEERTWTSPVPFKQTEYDMLRVNQVSPEISQFFLGGSQGVEPLLLAITPPGGYYPDPTPLSVDLLKNEFAMYFFGSQGYPPIPFFSIPEVNHRDAFTAYAVAYLDVSHPQTVQYQIGPRPDEDVDEDQDQLSDAWEYLFFGNLDSGPDEDSDEDQFPNLAEQNGGSIPTDAASVPDLPLDQPPAPIVTIARSGDEIVLSWQNYPQARYILQSADTIHSAWNDIHEFDPIGDSSVIREWRLPRDTWKTPGLLLRVLTSW